MTDPARPADKLAREGTPEHGISAFRLQFYAFCNRIGASDDLALAKTKMDEAAFWVREHLRKSQP